MEIPGRAHGNGTGENGVAATEPEANRGSSAKSQGLNKPEPFRIIKQIPVSSVIVSPERRKTINEAVVEGLMISVHRRGLLSPIRVTTGGSLLLGLQRLVAHERLGLEMIDGIETDGDVVELELDEIEENLLRRDLTVLERAMHEKRQKELYVIKYPDTARGVAGGRARQGQQAKHASFAAREAKARATSKRMVEQRIQIANSLTAEMVADLSNTAVADSHRQLLELARAPEDVRTQLVATIVEGTAQDVSGALRKMRPYLPSAVPHRARTADAALTKTDAGYAATTTLLGRVIHVTVANDLERVSLEDTGPVPRERAPSYPDDHLEVTPETLEEVVRETIEELPDVVRQDVRIAQTDTSYGRGSVAVTVRNRGTAWSLPVVEVEVCYWPQYQRDPRRGIDVSYENILINADGVGRPGFLAYVHTPENRGRLRQYLREALVKRILHKTHGLVAWPRRGDVDQPESQPTSDNVALAEAPAPTNGPDQSQKLEAALTGMGFKRSRVRKCIAALGDRVGTEPLEQLLRDGVVVLT